MAKSNHISTFFNASKLTALAKKYAKKDWFSAIPEGDNVHVLISSFMLITVSRWEYQQVFGQILPVVSDDPVGIDKVVLGSSRIDLNGVHKVYAETEKADQYAEITPVYVANSVAECRLIRSPGANIWVKREFTDCFTFEYTSLFVRNSAYSPVYLKDGSHEAIVMPMRMPDSYTAYILPAKEA